MVVTFLAGTDPDIQVSVYQEHTPLPSGEFTLALNYEDSVLEATLPYDANSGTAELNLQADFGDLFNVSEGEVAIECLDILMCTGRSVCIRILHARIHVDSYVCDPSR